MKQDERKEVEKVAQTLPACYVRMIFFFFLF